MENVLKMITVYENFDFLHNFPVMGEKYYYMTIEYRDIEVPKANYSKYVGSIGADLVRSRPGVPIELNL